MRLLLRVFCVLSIASCSANGEGAPPVDAREPFLSYDITDGLRCKPASGLLGCLREQEPVDARFAGTQPKRQGASLCLPVRSKATCFVDRDGLGYALLGHAGDKFVVVETEATGGYTVVLVDAANGSQRRVDNRPLYSSGVELFATVSYDTDAGYIPNRVAIWNAEQATPIYEFHNFSRGEGPTGIRWLGPFKLEVRYSRAAYSPDEGSTDTFTVWREEKGVWKNDYKR